ncbi:ATP-binding protein involved in chromosome partitioning [Agrobacterium larrymoorei]|uniref:Iron-sulfur cluster carrier protein n=1 Tax=Agrobacterium larrymoorei TaxID=160699 RepID=A0AAJ2BKL6_9HYPH|nr:iron-sulfur cluster carrier protein ApbC [Agrobacterium larrymoorei]MDR6104374.1 ATP-binding protein involved in chromosome partitioning [Agrobacterium larrymoorei]
MAQADKRQIEQALDQLIYPGSDKSIVALGMVSEIFLSDSKAYFSLTVPVDRAKELEPLRLAAEKATLAVPGVKAAVVALTANSRPGNASNTTAPKTPPTAPRPVQQQQTKAGVPGIGSIIAVASGKGGVGKSTTAVNLALGLQALGLRVGVLDADIYGPSVPRLLGISGRPKQGEGRTIMPMENYGLKVMSMGFLVDEEAAMIWRGPMVQSALMQMLREVVWGELDVLVLDMPPGTGDVQLTIAQQVPLAGAVIVSTPQDLALIDARKGITMFRKVEVPLLGVIENMSYFIAPDTGKRYDIFGHGGAQAEAERIGVPFLGAVPLTMSIREMSDAGTPIVVSEPDGPQAQSYREIAQKVWTEIGRGTARTAPKIIFE